MSSHILLFFFLRLSTILIFVVFPGLCFFFVGKLNCGNVYTLGTSVFLSYLVLMHSLTSLFCFASLLYYGVHNVELLLCSQYSIIHTCHLEVFVMLFFIVSKLEFYKFG